MKKITLVLALAFLITGCTNSSKIEKVEIKKEIKNLTSQNIKTEKATIIEMVLFNINDGISKKEAQKSITQLNQFVSQQKGFISRKTSVSEDNQFLDIVYWADLESAENASEKAMKNPETLEIFKIIKEEGMIFKHYSIFNEV